MRADPQTLDQLPTPSLIVERSLFDANVAAMAAAWPGSSLRPHVKAFKSTAIAGILAGAGHEGLCAATVREMEGLAAAGLGSDLLLANEVLDASRLGRLVDSGHRVTVAIDSDATVAAAAAGGVTEVLVDVNVGLMRCGCEAADAGRLADAARAAGLQVRGVMGYEGHLMMADAGTKAAGVQAAMEMLLEAHSAVGGDVVSGGGTGTFAVNRWVTELQAGSYCLLDTDYARLDSPFEIAVSVLASVISVTPRRWAVADAGLKAFGMDHGPPSWPGGEIAFVSDEHTTLLDREGTLTVGDRVRLLPGHLDPTVARHRCYWVVDGNDVIDRWPVDLRHW